MSDNQPNVQPEKNEHMIMLVGERDAYILLAAMEAMVKDNHSMQDTMTEAQWDRAEIIHHNLLQMVDGA